MLTKENVAQKLYFVLIIFFWGIHFNNVFAQKGITKLTILYTSDTHYPSYGQGKEDSANEFLSKVQARADLIKKIRAEESNVLLFDAGDFFYCSQYFETLNGAFEIEAMNKMGYDAVCLGEKEFESGLDNLSLQLTNAKFAVLCTNFRSEKMKLQSLIKPYVVIEKAGLKIGVFSIGIDINGLVPDEISKEIKYNDALKIATETAKHLKKTGKCDFTICLSHLGLKETVANKISSTLLAKESEEIDIIISGHSQHLLNKPLKYCNRKKQEVYIVQAGRNGSHLGRIDYAFSTRKNILSPNAQTVEIGK